MVNTNKIKQMFHGISFRSVFRLKELKSSWPIQAAGLLKSPAKSCNSLQWRKKHVLHLIVYLKNTENGFWRLDRHEIHHQLGSKVLKSQCSMGSPSFVNRRNRCRSFTFHALARPRSCLSVVGAILMYHPTLSSQSLPIIPITESHLCSTLILRHYTHT